MNSNYCLCTFYFLLLQSRALQPFPPPSVCHLEQVPILLSLACPKCTSDLKIRRKKGRKKKKKRSCCLHPEYRQCRVQTWGSLLAKVSDIPYQHVPILSRKTRLLGPNWYYIKEPNGWGRTKGVSCFLSSHWDGDKRDLRKQRWSWLCAMLPVDGQPDS